MLPPSAPAWTHRRDGPLFFTHIPRTAGTELSELLQAMLPQPNLSWGAVSGVGTRELEPSTSSLRPLLL